MAGVFFFFVHTFGASARRLAMWQLARTVPPGLEDMRAADSETCSGTAASSSTDDEAAAFQATAGSRWAANGPTPAGGASHGREPAAYSCDGGVGGPCAPVAEWPSSDDERSGDARHSSSDADDSRTDGDSDSADGWEWGGAAGETARMAARPRRAAEPARCATFSVGRAGDAPAAAAAPHERTPPPSPTPPPTPPSAPRRVPPPSPPVQPDSLCLGAAEVSQAGEGFPRPDRRRRRMAGYWAGGEDTDEGWAPWGDTEGADTAGGSEGGADDTHFHHCPPEAPERSLAHGEWGGSGAGAGGGWGGSRGGGRSSGGTDACHAVGTPHTEGACNGVDGCARGFVCSCEGGSCSSTCGVTSLCSCEGGSSSCAAGVMSLSSCECAGACSSSAGVIGLCPAGDEPRLRSQLSWLRSQLHAAQLERSRAAGELSMAQHRLRESEAWARKQAAEVAELQARMWEGGGVGLGEGGGGGEGGSCVGAGGGNGSCALISGRDARRSAPLSHPAPSSLMMSLAETRLTELEALLASKDSELARVQSSSWGGWAQDAAVHAELRRLQDEISQAHVEVVRLGRALVEAEAGREEEARRREDGVMREGGARRRAEEGLAEARAEGERLRRELDQAMEALQVGAMSRGGIAGDRLCLCTRAHTLALTHLYQCTLHSPRCLQHPRTSAPLTPHSEATPARTRTVSIHKPPLNHTQLHTQPLPSPTPTPNRSPPPPPRRAVTPSPPSSRSSRACARPPPGATKSCK
jgi:hypothetical protein